MLPTFEKASSPSFPSVQVPVITLLSVVNRAKSMTGTHISRC